VSERLTAQELGELLSLSPSTVLDRWQAGDLPGFRLFGRKGGPVRFRLSDIEAASATASTTTASPSFGGGMGAEPSTIGYARTPRRFGLTKVRVLKREVGVFSGLPRGPQAVPFPSPKERSGAIESEGRLSVGESIAQDNLCRSQQSVRYW
jgi:Helix-turn-helix domain